MIQEVTSHTNPTSIAVLPKDWSIMPIQNLCLKITSGGTPFRGNSEYYLGGTIPWYKTQELKDCFLEDSEECITEKGLQNSSAKVFPAKTVLLALYGDGRTITSLGILRKPGATNQACCALIADPDVCYYRYLFYAFMYHRSDLLLLATGGAQRNLSGKLIREFAIRVPPLDEQRAIARVLGALDDKIELNRRMNKTLEEMASAIFKSWFVDFDPVIAKSEGKQPFGMSAEVAALFPDSFEETENGPIPKGWYTGRLDEMLLLQRGFDLPAQARKPGPYPVVTSSGPTGSHCEARVAGPGVTTGRSGLLGKVFYIHGDFWPLNTSLWVKEFRLTGPCYAYFLLSSIDLSVFNAGSAVATLNRNHVHNLPVVIPSEEIIRYFETVSASLFAHRAENNNQSNTLRSMRDMLLPKLLTGEIRIKQAEKMVEAVV